MTIEKAVELVACEYEKAVKNPIVHDAVAYALYHAWRKADSEKKRKAARND